MKRILCICLVFMLLFTSTAFASETAEPDEQEIQRIITETVIIDSDATVRQSIQPRYTYLLHMTVGIDVDENGRIIYGGSARALNYNLRITLTLQRSTTGMFWEDLETTIKIGYDNLAVDGWRNASSGDYFYRVKIVTEVLDTNRNVIETAIGCSTEIRR